MNSAYQAIIAASDGERRGLFLTTANRVGTTIQNIEKDFWVCWTLETLFHRLKNDRPRLLFKGGTSLSKAYGLISRFSEDIDVTVFREDIGAGASLEKLESLSKKKRRDCLNSIKEACQKYINGPLRAELEAFCNEAMEAAGRDPATLQVLPDDGDKDAQSLLIRYPSVVGASDYVRPSVKIESGAKSALDPHTPQTITPYLAADFVRGEALTIDGVTTIDPERTFLDKILILHGMNFYFNETGALRGNGRMSRHYYDVHRLMTSSIGESACGNSALIEDCIRHAQMFFYRRNTGLEQAQRGSFRLAPSAAMYGELAKDYEAMSTMIFGNVPSFETVLQSIKAAEEQLNLR